MFAAMVLVIGAAQAVSHEWGGGVGAHASTGLRTGIPVVGTHGALLYRLQGDGASGLQIEAHDLWGTTASGSAHLVGIKVGWSRDWGEEEASRQVYSLVSMGGHLSDVLPVLPTLWLETGVEIAGEGIRWRVGPELYGLPPFFVGGGLRVTATVGMRP